MDAVEYYEATTHALFMLILKKNFFYHKSQDFQFYIKTFQIFLWQFDCIFLLLRIIKVEAKSKHIHIKYTSVRENVKETKGVQKAYYHLSYWLLIP